MESLLTLLLYICFFVFSVRVAHVRMEHLLSLLYICCSFYRLDWHTSAVSVCSYCCIICRLFSRSDLHTSALCDVRDLAEMIWSEFGSLHICTAPPTRNRE